MVSLSKLNLVKSSYDLYEKYIESENYKENVSIGLHGNEIRILNNYGDLIAKSSNIGDKDKVEIVNGKSYIAQIEKEKLNIYYSNWEDKNFEYIRLQYELRYKRYFDQVTIKEKTSFFLVFGDDGVSYLIWNNELFKVSVDSLRQSINVIEKCREDNIAIKRNHSVFVWNTENVHKSCNQFNFKGLRFVSTKIINVATKFTGTVYDTTLQLDGNICCVKDKDKILGQIYDKKSINVIRTLNSNRNILILKDGQLHIYTLAQVYRDMENVVIRKTQEVEKRFKVIKDLIKFGCKFNDKIWLFFTENNSSNEGTEYILFLPENKYCHITLNGNEIILKKLLHKTDFIKQKQLVKAMVIDCDQISFREETDSDNNTSNKSECFNEILENKKGVNGKEFLELINRYQQIEDELLAEMKLQTPELRYNRLENDIFYIEKISEEELEKLNNRVGCYVKWLNNKKEVPLGVIKEVGEDYIKVDFNNDEARDKISHKKGRICLDLEANDTMQRRRKYAVDVLNNNLGACFKLQDILCSNHQFNSLKVKKTVSKYANDRVIVDKQYDAIIGALNTEDIFLIQGPPGTGKTTVIRRIVEELIKSDNEVLVTSFQNLAVDNVINGFLGYDIIPYRYGAENNNAMKTICENIVEQINENIKQNCATELEEKLLEFRENLKSIRKELQLAEGIENIKKSLIKLGYCLNEYQGKSSNYMEIENLIESLKKNEANDTEDIRAITAMLPENFELSYEFVCSLDKVKKALEGLNRTIKSSTIVRIIEKISFMIDYDNIVEMNEAQYKKEKSYILGELKLISSKEEKKENNDIDVIQKALDILNDILDKVPEYVEDKKYPIVKEFQKKINNSPNLIEDVLKKYADIYGTTCQKTGSYGFNIATNGANYSYVIVDEAARANPLDLIIPIIKGEKIILVGDHNQLPHMIEGYVESKFVEDGLVSKEKYEEYIKESLFGRLYRTLPQDRKIMLDTQYRMTKEISDLVSELFYDNKLYTGTDITNDTPLYTGKALVAVNIEGSEIASGGGKKSYINKEECNAIIEKFLELDKKCQVKCEKFTVGVISFYKAQAELIKKKLVVENFKNIDITVGTVDAYQGLEKDIILLSTVRSDKIGFTSNPNRLNVSISRAKRLLVIFSNISNMRKDTLFNKIFDKCYIEEV